MTPARPTAVLLALAAVVAVALWRSGPPPPRGADAPAAEFSAARAEEVLRRLAGDEAPRPPGSAAHARFRERLLSEISRLGLAPVVESGFACAPHGSCASLTNVLAELPGTLPGPAVLLSSHYDSVGAGPGVGDDAASVAALLEAARALLTSPRRNPVLLLFDDGEEAGLLGAELFVRSGRLPTVGAVVNLEARGTSGASFLFETSRDNAWLVRRAVARLPRPVTSSVLSFVYDRLPNDTDLTVFKREGLPGLNLAFIGSAARYHTREDSLANLSRASLQHQGENVLALARALSNEDVSSLPGGEAVFFDLAGVFVVSWPTEASPAIALLALALVRAACVRRGGRLLPRPSALLPLVGPLAAALAGGAAWQLLRLAGAFPVPFVAHPWASTLAAATAALAAALPVLAAESRWTGSAVDSWERIWTSTALLGLALAATVPELSFLLVVPALAAGVARLALPEPASPWIPFGVLGLVLLSLGLRMPEALGPAGLPIVALALGLAAGAIPLASAPGACRLPAGVLAGACAVSSAAALLLPGTTPDRPEHGSMLAVEEAGAGRASLAYLPGAGRVHRDVAAAARFERKGDALPWTRRPAAMAAPLAPLGQPFPSLEVLDEERRPDGTRRLRLRLTSPRRATSVGLFLPGGAAPGSIRVQGQPLAPAYLRGGRPGAGATRLFCRAAPLEGIVIELTLPVEKRDAIVFDQTQGLPATALALARARPGEVAAADGGDLTVLYRKTGL